MTCIVSFRPKKRTGPLLKIFGVPIFLYCKKCNNRGKCVYTLLIFVIPVCHKYNCLLTKVDWIAACIAIRVIGAVFDIFLRRWRTICTVLQSPAKGKQGPLPEEMS